MDIVGFMRRIGVTSKTELSKMLGTKPQNINKWFNKDRKDPTYEMCVKLLSIGMTVEELFGPEVAKKTSISGGVQNLNERCSNYSANLDMNNPEVKSAVEQAFRDMLMKTAESIGDKK